MHKLHFRYGTMFSGKSHQLYSIYDSYKRQGKLPCLIVPAHDTRDGYGVSKARLLDKIDADIVLRSGYSLCPSDFYGMLSFDRNDFGREVFTSLGKCGIILVDEVQFFTAEQVSQIRELTEVCPVVAFGLKTDWQGKLFEGSKKMIELCDKLEEIKSSCHYCNNSAKFNLKISKTDAEVGNGYMPVCWECWREKNAQIYI